MSIMRGTDGLVQVCPDFATPVWATVASKQSWTFEKSNEVIDVTVLGAQRARDQMTTFLGFNASTDGFWDPDDFAAAEGQGIIRAAALSGNNIGLRIYPAVTGAGVPAIGDPYVEGEVVVASLNESGAFDGAVQASVQFSGRGAYVDGTAP